MAVYKRNNVCYIDYIIKVNGKNERRREPVSPRRDEAEARLKEYREIVKAGKDPKTTIEFYTNEDHVLKPIEIIVPMLTQFVQIFLKLHGNYKSKKNTGILQKQPKPSVTGIREKKTQYHYKNDC